MLAFRGRRTLRGNGLGGVFSWLKRISLPMLKQVGSYLGTKLLNTGGNIITDIQEGADPSQSLKSRVTETGKELMQTAKTKAKGVKKALWGKGKKKKKLKQCKKNKGKKPRKKKRTQNTLRTANTDLF